MNTQFSKRERTQFNFSRGDSLEFRVSWRECPRLGELGILNVGMIEEMAPSYYNLMQRKYTVISIGETGVSEIFVKGKWIPFPENHFKVHSYTQKTGTRAIQGKACTMAWIAFDERRSRELNTQTFSNRPIPLDPTAICSAIRMMISELEGPANPSALVNCAELIDIFVGRLLKDKALDPRVSNLIRKLHTSLSYPWSVSEMAKLCHVSDVQLRRLFKRYCNRSPMAHLTQLRLTRAAYLLQETNQTVEWVAHEVGYSDSFAFSVAFKRHFRQSPSVFRKAVVKG